MENAVKSHWKNSINYGLITGAVLILFSLLLYAFDLWDNKGLSLLSYLLLLILMFLGTKGYRDKTLEGFIGFGKAFNAAFFIGLFATVLLTVYTYVFFKFFDPGAIEKMMELAEEAMRNEQSNASEEDIELAMSYAAKFMKPGAMAIMGLIYNVVASVILALLVGAVVKKEAPGMTDNQ
jgi:hypothetical protein